jgi:flavodoxin
MWHEKEVPMKALVVYESMWGNTESVARGIAAGLGEFADVEVADVAAGPVELGPDVELIVAGGPTHAFSMTRANTRADAVRQGARQGTVTTGLREWLDGLPSGQRTPKVATFDTRADKVRHLPGSAAKSAARAARRHGFAAAAAAESFYVRDVGGPLLDGELDRATAWGRHLGRSIGD